MLQLDIGILQHPSSVLLLSKQVYWSTCTPPLYPLSVLLLFKQVFLSTYTLFCIQYLYSYYLNKFIGVHLVPPPYHVSVLLLSKQVYWSTCTPPCILYLYSYYIIKYNGVHTPPCILYLYANYLTSILEYMYSPLYPVSVLLLYKQLY